MLRLKYVLLLSTLLPLILLHDAVRAQAPEAVKQSDTHPLAEEESIDIDTIYLHHTGMKPGIDIMKLSKGQKDRLYHQSSDPDENDYIPQDGQMHSGHFRIINGKKVEVFWAYHWLIRTNGLAVRLLSDEEVGRHVPDVDERYRSIAICFDGDYSATPPNRKMLLAAARLIKQYDKEYPIMRLKAHYDVRDTECPGPWFYQILEYDLTGRELLLRMANVHILDE